MRRRLTGRLTRIAAARALVAVIIVAGGVGCFGMSAPKKPRAIESAAGIDPSITPFKLEVVEELHDGADLVIKGRLTPKDEWNPKDVVVRLAALDDHGQQRVSFHRVSDLAPQAAVLTAGVSTPFSLTLPSAGLTNYQVEVLWGQEAQPFGQPSTASPAAGTESNKPFLALRNLEVHRVPGESCATPNECELKFTITGEFFNSGGATVRNVVIVAGFTTSDKLDLTDQILENERRIEVRNMGLKPGASKPFRLALEKFVTALDQAAPQPAVRIISVDSDL